MDEAMFAELLESVREGMSILRGEAAPARITTMSIEQALAHKPAPAVRVVTTVRLPIAVHRMLRLQAQREGISLNALIVRVLSEHTEAVLAAARQQLFQRITVDDPSGKTFTAPAHKEAPCPSVHRRLEPAICLAFANFAFCCYHST